MGKKKELQERSVIAAGDKYHEVLANAFTFKTSSGQAFEMHKIDTGLYECYQNGIAKPATSKMWKEKDIKFMLDTKRWKDYEIV
jgi:hypothetical protein